MPPAPGSSTSAAMRLGRERMLDDLEDVRRRRAAAHGGEQAELVVGAQVVIGLDVVVADGEERVGTVLGELGVTVDDGRPGRLDRPAFREV